MFYQNLSYSTDICVRVLPDITHKTQNSLNDTSCQISKMELFVKIMNCWKLFTIFAKSFFLAKKILQTILEDVGQFFEYASDKGLFKMAYLRF